jgi:hypothetical protein
MIHVLHGYNLPQNLWAKQIELYAISAFENGLASVCLSHFFLIDQQQLNQNQ